MSHYQTGSLAILALGISLIVMSAPVMRHAARNYAATGTVEHEGELIVWISRILGSIVSILGLVTYLQS